MSIWCQSPSHGQRATCYRVSMEIPKVPLEKPICVLQTVTASVGEPSRGGHAAGSGLMNGIARRQADGSPLVLRAPHKLVGKALVSCGAGEREHPIPKSRRVRSWGDRRGHPALRDICGCNQPDGTHISKHPGCPESAYSTTQDTICSVQSAVSVGGRGLLCSFYRLIYGLFTWMPHLRC